MRLNKVNFCSMCKETYSVSYDNDVDNCPQHGHPFCELILFTDGTGEHVINDTPHTFSPGSIALLSPSDIHGWKNDPGVRHSCIKLRFSYAFYFSRLSEQCCFKHLPVSTRLHEGDFATALTLFALLHQEEQSPHRINSPLFAENLIEQILILLQRNLAAGEKDLPSNHIPSQRILQYLQAHFHEPITAAQVAKTLNYSPKYFSHLFTKEFNMPFQEYLQEQRLNYAFTLVKYSDTPIIDVCYRSGFRTPSYFSTAFKRKFGQSPRDVRHQASE